MMRHVHSQIKLRDYNRGIRSLETVHNVIENISLRSDVVLCNFADRFRAHTATLHMKEIKTNLKSIISPYKDLQTIHCLYSLWQRSCVVFWRAALDVQVAHEGAQSPPTSPQ